MLILLADDERLIRLGLQSMLEELYPEKHTYLHARNGNEVISILKKQTPDVAFLDIKMPLMNGLEALKICKQLSDSTVWIILSGYADFEYARQAISLSTFDYILKPVELDTLKNLFDRIEINRAKNRKHSNTVFEHDVIRSFNMADQFSSDETEFLPSKASDYILYQFYIDFLDQEIQKKIQQKLCNNLQKYCISNVSIINHCLFFNNDGNLCLVCDAPNASLLTHFISTQAEDLPPNAFSVFWGNKKTMRDIYEVSQRISYVADIRLIQNYNEPTFIKNVEVLPALTAQLSFAKELTSIINAYIGQNKIGFHQKLSVMKQHSEFVSVFAQINTTVLGNCLSYIFGKPILVDTYDELLELLEEYQYNMNHSTLLASIVDVTQIQNYIETHYAQNVSISHVSELFNISPNYLSKLFHEKTGQKYIDFVTQVRMEAAKKIISTTPSISVKQVAEAVGYYSVRHFSKTFQKYTGMFPSNYHN